MSQATDSPVTPSRSAPPPLAPANAEPFTAAAERAILLSAASHTQLLELVEGLRDQIAQNPDSDLATVARELARYHNGAPWRAGLLAASTGELGVRLDECALLLKDSGREFVTLPGRIHLRGDANTRR